MLQVSTNTVLNENKGEEIKEKVNWFSFFGGGILNMEGEFSCIPPNFVSHFNFN